MRLLLLDTCGETGSLALAQDGHVVRERTLAPRTASAQLVSAIREELEAVGWPLRTLRAVGVVNGPGSFTGVRVGLAAAKGLCEVAGLELVTVSRLELLLNAGGARREAVAVLDAGRGEYYVRSAADGGEELLMGRDGLADHAAQRQVLVAEEKVLVALEPLHPWRIDLGAGHALGITLARLGGEGDSVESADANYVRQARALYAARSVPEPAEGA